MGQPAQLNEHPPLQPRWFLPAVDVALVFVAFTLAYVVRYDWQILRPALDPSRASFSAYLPYAALYALMLFISHQANFLYRHLRGRSLGEEASAIMNGVASVTIVTLALFFILQPLVTSRLMLIYVAALVVVLHMLARVGQRVIFARQRARGIGVQRVLVVGMGATGQAVVGTMISRADLGYEVIGFLDNDPQTAEMEFRTVTRLGAIADFRHALDHHPALDVVVITLAWKHYDDIRSMVQVCHERGLSVRLVPDILQLNMRQLHVENLDGIPLLGIVTPQPFGGTDRILKRALDLVIVLGTAPLWLPVMGVIALAIKRQNDGDIFYIQRRIGENGREFNMIKFRSMIPNADAMRQALIAQYGLDPKHPKMAKDPRITPLGDFLRRTSLDELPNLFNVIKGEMSLVGPRPPMPDEVELYESWHKQRLQFIPGITGLWQVSGRSTIPFDEMCLMDIYYIENWSLKFDLQILLMTIPRVLLRVGAL